MKDVSSLMDGELDRKRARSTIARLEGQDDLWDAWATFHVIRDTLQGNAIGPSRFVERFHDRLEHEPAPQVPAWRTRLPRMRTLAALGAAALLLGGLAIAWLSGGISAPAGRGTSAPLVDGGLNDPIASEFAMAHRQLVPAFVSEAGAPAQARP